MVRERQQRFREEKESQFQERLQHSFEAQMCFDVKYQELIN